MEKERKREGTCGGKSRLWQMNSRGRENCSFLLYWFKITIRISIHYFTAHRLDNTMPSDHTAGSKMHFMKALIISAVTSDVSHTSNEKLDWSFLSLPPPHCDLNDCRLLKFTTLTHLERSQTTVSKDRYRWTDITMWKKCCCGIRKREPTIQAAWHQISHQLFSM